MPFLSDTLLKELGADIDLIIKQQASQPKLVAALQEIKKALVSFGSQNRAGIVARFLGDKAADAIGNPFRRVTIQQEVAQLIVSLYLAALELRGVKSTATTKELNDLAQQIIKRAPTLKAAFDAYDKNLTPEEGASSKPKKTARLAKFLGAKKSAVTDSKDQLIQDLVSLLKNDGLLPKQNNLNMFDDLKNLLLVLLLNLEVTLNITALLDKLIVKDKDLGEFAKPLLELKAFWPEVLLYARNSMESLLNNIFDEHYSSDIRLLNDVMTLCEKGDPLANTILLFYLARNFEISKDGYFQNFEAANTLQKILSVPDEKNKTALLNLYFEILQDFQRMSDVKIDPGQLEEHRSILVVAVSKSAISADTLKRFDALIVKDDSIEKSPLLYGFSTQRQSIESGAVLSDSSESAPPSGRNTPSPTQIGHTRR